MQTVTHVPVPKSAERLNFDQYLAKIHQELADRIAKIGAVEHIAIVKHESDANRWQMILPDVSGRNAWRTQSFDLNGFSGHHVFKDKDAAIKDAAQSHFTVRDDGALDRLQDTLDFQLGLYATEQIQHLNFGRISFADYTNRLSDYRKQFAVALH